MSKSPQYYLLRNNEKFGPFSQKELLKKFPHNSYQANDMIWDVTSSPYWIPAPTALLQIIQKSQKRKRYRIFIALCTLLLIGGLSYLSIPYLEKIYKNEGESSTPQPSALSSFILNDKPISNLEESLAIAKQKLITAPVGSPLQIALIDYIESFPYYNTDTIDPRSEEMASYISHVIRLGDLSTIKYLENQGLSFDEFFIPVPEFFDDTLPVQSGLTASLYLGKDALIDYFIKSAEYKRKKVNGSAALYVAAKSGNKKNLKKLFDADFSFYAQDYNGQSFLDTSLDKDIKKLLKANGALSYAMIMLPEGNPKALELCTAIETKNIKRVEELLNTYKRDAFIGPILLNTLLDSIKNDNLDSFLSLLIWTKDFAPAKLPNDSELLIHADKYAAEEVTAWLLANGKDFKLDQILYEVAGNGNLDLVKKLVDRGANIHYSPNKDSLPLALNIITQDKNLPILQFLVEKGASLYHNNLHALDKAIENNCLNIVKFIIDHDPTLNLNDNSNTKNSYFIKAIYGGNLDIVRYMHSKGVDLNTTFNYGFTPLYAASQSKAGEKKRSASPGQGYIIVDYMIRNGAKITSDHTGWTPLVYSVRARNNVTLIQYYLEKGLDINTLDNSGRNILHHTSYLKTIKRLVALNADPKIISKYGRNLLMNIISNGPGRWDKNFEFYNYCIENGSSINHIDQGGQNALHILYNEGAADDSAIRVTDFLLSKGINPNVIDQKGHTPLMLHFLRNKRTNRFQSKKDIALIDSLIQAGADLSITTPLGENILDIIGPAEPNQPEKQAVINHLMNKGGIKPKSKGTIITTLDIPPDDQLKALWPKPITTNCLVLEITHSHENQNYTHLAEIELLDAEEKRIPKNGWNIIASSFEKTAEDGKTSNLLDGNLNTIWHTQYTGSTPPPYTLKITFDKPTTIKGILFFNRENKLGAPKKINVYAEP